MTTSGRPANGHHHLDDDQFAACALGMEVSPAISAHVAECSDCGKELARFCATVSDFGAASLDWSAARSPMSLRQQLRKTSAGVQPARKSRFAVASWAVATG